MTFFLTSALRWTLNHLTLKKKEVKEKKFEMLVKQCLKKWENLSLSAKPVPRFVPVWHHANTLWDPDYIW